MAAPNDRRVVITGLGVLSPIGIGRKKFWSNLIKGKNGVKEIKSFDASRYRTHKGGEVKDFNPEKFIKKVKLPSFCRSAQLALSAARLAIDDAGLEENDLSWDKDRTGVIIGSTTVDPRLGEKYALVWAKRGYKNTPKNTINDVNVDFLTVGPACCICSEFSISGLSLSLPAACAAGNYTIGYGFDLVESGRLDIVLAGGTDPMNQLVFGGFNSFLSMDPEKCRPFDLTRKGLVVSEGSGVVVLEELGHAKKRGADVYAEVLGYGFNCDAYHTTGFHPDGLGAVRAAEMAFTRAQISPDDIDYINAHGTATALNDKIETRAIKKIFGKRAKKIPVSSIKSMIGHTMGAASAIEAVACSMVVKEDIIPPTINYHTPDPECDLDYVPNVARRQKVNTVLSNSFGFGGYVGMLLIGKFNG
ncbi:MAG: beta-ketoacyl-[acyl-carrier-protein] synthase family protein [Candidatus Omnitrophota bacterium]